MMMMKQLTVALFTFWIGSISYAANPWQSYSLTQYPASSLGCKGTAKELADKFSKATGLSIFKATCEKESQNGYDILITYVSSTAAAIVSNIQEESGLGGLGLYRTQKECEANLSREIDTFSKNTGFSPFVSYCLQKSSLGKTPYFPRVDAAGTAKFVPFRIESTLYADTVKGSEKFLKEISDAFKDANIAVHQVLFTDDGSKKLVIRFYGLFAEVKFHSSYSRIKEMAVYSGKGTRDPLKACEQQAQEAEAGFSSQFKSKAIWFCGWDSTLFEAKLYVVRVRPTEGVKTETLPDGYSSFSECEKERSAVLSLYEKSLGIKPFVALCSWRNWISLKPEAFVIKVLTKTADLEPIFGNVDTLLKEAQL